MDHGYGRRPDDRVTIMPWSTWVAPHVPMRNANVCPNIPYAHVRCIVDEHITGIAYGTLMDCVLSVLLGVLPTPTSSTL